MSGSDSDDEGPLIIKVSEMHVNLVHTAMVFLILVLILICLYLYLYLQFQKRGNRSILPASSGSEEDEETEVKVTYNIIAGILHLPIKVVFLKITLQFFL